ncbi:MAG: glycosyl transferase family 2 [Oceanospirillaceae bacterium]|nr:glycosyl transferase family 2 [Oceanospirillaceae bacterium]
MSDNPELSLIIPVGPGEAADFPLLRQLSLLPSNWEILFALCEPRADLSSLVERDFYTVISSADRAVQMNRASEVARGRWLWFLHLDSILTAGMISGLQRALVVAPEALHYFRLGFAADGAGPTRFNAWGANLRSRWLGVPFGDQGFCLPAQVFSALGGYPERVSYGEDHLLVWYARQAGIALHEVDATLVTSARKYKRGWLRLTLLYQWRWLRQAAPECGRLLVRRLARRCLRKTA